MKGDIQRARQDGLLKSIPGSSIAGLEIDFKHWHEALKASVISKPAGAREVRGIYRSLKEVKGEPDGKNPLKSFKFLYPPVDNLVVTNLTYEIFIEIVNKTDWHLRRLVESLENKLVRDKKYYHVEQARIRGKIRGS